MLDQDPTVHIGQTVIIPYKIENLLCNSLCTKVIT